MFLFTNNEHYYLYKEQLHLQVGSHIVPPCFYGMVWLSQVFAESRSRHSLLFSLPVRLAINIWIAEAIVTTWSECYTC